MLKEIVVINIEYPIFIFNTCEQIIAIVILA